MMARHLLFLLFLYERNPMNWIWFALLSGSGSAILAILVKMHLRHINPLFIFLMFSVVTVIAFTIIDLFTNQVEWKLITTLSFKDWLALVVSGILNSAAFVSYLNALKHGPTGAAVAVDRLGIIFAVALAALVLKDTLTVQAIIGSMMMVAGAFLISM